MLGRPELKISGGMSHEREIALAWLQHQHSERIPLDIWRQLRSIKREIEPTSLKIKAALNDEASLRSLVEGCCRRRGMARQRVLKGVRDTYPDATIKIANGNVLEISWLAPSPPVIANPKDFSERQACTLVCYAVAWPTPPFGFELRSAWSLEVPDHAAGRYLQRAGWNADLRSALFGAANHFAAADIAEVKPHVGRGTDIYIPAGRGCFVCTVVGARSGANKFLYARAATWVDEMMLHTDQVPLREAEAAERSVAALLLDPN